MNTPITAPWRQVTGADPAGAADSGRHCSLDLTDIVIANAAASSVMSAQS
jgi:hypothetical protein